MSNMFPELVFALVGALGTDLEMVQLHLAESLEDVGYTPIEVSLTDTMRALQKAPWSELPSRGDPDYYDKAIAAGNKLREESGEAFAMMALGIHVIRGRRAEKEYGDKRAHIIRSLKRPEEVDLLRKVYGPAAFVVSVYTPRDQRVNQLARKLAAHSIQHHGANKRDQAERLINVDEEERESTHGQRLRKTFPLADLFLDASSQESVKEEIGRFITLIFGNSWETPTIDEQGMASAYLARLRSRSPARQVGAALTSGRGEVLALGTNEAARFGGGQYWSGDSPSA